MSDREWKNRNLLRNIINQHNYGKQLTAATYKNEKAVFLQPQAYVDYRMYLAKKSFDEIADDILNRLIEKEV